MASAQSSAHLQTFLPLNCFPQQVGQKQRVNRNRSTHRVRVVRADASQSASLRRKLVGVGLVVPWVSVLNNVSSSFAAENKKGFLPVMDRKDGYEFLYPFGWQEVAIEGQDKAFKDVIEPLESVSVNIFPTNRQNIKEFGSPKEVAETLIQRVLSSSSQKSKLIEAAENDVDGKTYYTFEFVAQAPNFTRHSLSAITIGNGKFYTLTTGANERRWDKMKERLQTVVASFKIFDVVM